MLSHYRYEPFPALPCGDLRDQFRPTIPVIGLEALA
jgi:hypothetical protein